MAMPKPAAPAKLPMMRALALNEHPGHEARDRLVAFAALAFFLLAQRTLDRLRTMLGDLAFKRNLRLWIWSSDTEARAIAGWRRARPKSLTSSS